MKFLKTTDENNFAAGEPAILEVTPNTTWPDVVYYNSFTHADMGWKIHIVDSYTSASRSLPPIQMSAQTVIFMCIFAIFAAL
jgi:hypothetical protein